MKLLLDEMWPPEVAVQLRRRGHDVVAIAERPELRGKPDEVVFAVAQREERAVVTENASDYRPLAAYELQQGRSHYGLLLTSDKRFPRRDPRTAGRLVTALDDLLSPGSVPVSLEYWLSYPTLRHTFCTHIRCVSCGSLWPPRCRADLRVRPSVVRSLFRRSGTPPAKPAWV